MCRASKACYIWGTDPLFCDSGKASGCQFRADAFSVAKNVSNLRTCYSNPADDYRFVISRLFRNLCQQKTFSPEIWGYAALSTLP